MRCGAAPVFLFTGRWHNLGPAVVGAGAGGYGLGSGVSSPVRLWLDLEVSAGVIIGFDNIF